MKANEVDILIVSDPGEENSDHWQSRWEAKLSTARRIAIKRQAGGVSAAEWIKAVETAALSCRKPVILVAHGLGVAAAVHAAPQLAGKICGGFFVSPPDLAKLGLKLKQAERFPPYPDAPLPFPGIVIASRNSPLGDFAAAEKLAENWHSLFLDAGESGHINAESGHGPWPEGLMVFSQFLANLPEPNAAKQPEAAPAAAKKPGKPADKKHE